jgi:hypothetical protein
MISLNKRPWLKSAILFGVVYLVVGITFAAFAKLSNSDEMKMVWRWSAWIISAATFAFHTGYERYRLHSPPLAAAFHISIAVALGAFGLALAANVYAIKADSNNLHLHVLALVLWPIVTAAPAFLVAWAVSSAWLRSRSGSNT